MHEPLHHQYTVKQTNNDHHILFCLVNQHNSNYAVLVTISWNKYCTVSKVQHEICTALNSQQQFLVHTSSTYPTVGAPGYYCISSQIRHAQAVSLPRMSDRRAAEASTYIKHTSMPSAAFQPAVLQIELVKTYALDRAATAVTYNSNYFCKFTFSSRICF